ncbi:Crp/Fnr family transcriptional regulator [Alkalihalobacillus sp. AL-G]|uniref:Crp/Fnr family transcriptional regulator n=1 Tax=Alkalihalobacillus sp. AL-G TaxID=2926399 RepID=UPI0027298B4A|nr:Crp/Fnr family transcriptional regulator [Alkalihalobacillus sp. AL-G]WLD94763.1 Crp/Fnr family transcriptional regulator [Alkalihalobacillus sp. AL-G]
MQTTDQNIMTLSPWMDELNFSWDELEQKGVVREYKKHEILFHFGFPVDRIYLVKSGRIRLFLTSDDGKEKAIAIIGKNGLLGESCTYHEQTYICSAITATSATVIELKPATFHEVVFRNPRYTEQVLELMSAKIRLLTMQSLYLSFGSPLQRMCDALVHLGLTYGKKLDDDRILITISFTHQELADLIGATRVTVVNTLKDLMGQRLLSKENKYYVIDDLPGIVAYQVSSGR